MSLRLAAGGDGVELLVTCGPDINNRLREEMNNRLDTADRYARVKYYTRPLATCHMNTESLFNSTDPRRIHGTTGKSIRTSRRSVIAPVIELHPDESDRLEFKLFEATNQLHNCHTNCVPRPALLLQDGLEGGASDRTYARGLGAVVRGGEEADNIQMRAAKVPDDALNVLQRHRFCSQALNEIDHRLQTNRLPCSEITQQSLDPKSIVDIFFTRTDLVPETTDAQR